MQIGFCLPYMKNGVDRATILDWCRRIDQGPFSTISCGERVTGPAATYDMRVLLSAAAAVTERVTIMPSLYVLPAHSAVRAAQEIATLDVLSGGRLTLTVGYGGREKDYRAVGAAYKGRYQRMDEQVETLRRIWAGEPPFPGADPVGPRPLRPEGPPILAGVMGPKSVARASRWADGLYAWSLDGIPTELERIFGMADEAWEAAGRRERPRRVAGFWYSLAEEDAAGKLERYCRDYLRSTAGEKIAGAMAAKLHRNTPESVLEAIEGVEALGVDELLLVPATAELAEVDRVRELVEKRAR
jgi:alkanesulfonate monooxygenase SsuD/methylene tetrahydromethanopterin reductase-like flavin-dependent oxidoreductase (luciferase family)